MTNIGQNRAPIFTRMQKEEEPRAESRRVLKNDKRPSEAGVDIDSGSTAEKTGGPARASPPGNVLKNLKSCNYSVRAFAALSPPELSFCWRMKQ